MCVSSQIRSVYSGPPRKTTPLRLGRLIAPANNRPSAKTSGMADGRRAQSRLNVANRR